MTVTEEFDCYLDDKEGKQNVVDDIVELCKRLHLLYLLCKGKFGKDYHTKQNDHSKNKINNLLFF